MNCRFCGTALPEEAVFCGECGRPAVSASGRRRASVPQLALGARSASPLVAELDVPRSGLLPEERVLSLEAEEPELPSCPQCGRIVLATDIFCGDCGFVLASATMPEPEPEPEPVAETPVAVADARDTAVIAPGDLEFTGIVVHTAPREVVLSGVEIVAERDEAEASDDGEVVDESEITEIAEPHEAEAAVAEEETPAADIPSIVASVRTTAPSPFAPDPARLMVAAAAARTEAAPAASVEDDPEPLDLRAADPREAEGAKPLRTVPDPFPWGKGTVGAPIDLEKTRAVATGPAEERFVLQFSTGESVTVTGAGLVGRNPSAQPGEFVDQLVAIFDAGKSVSKTHLEFGQDSGRFWVSDRYSTNGSTVRQPDLEPKRCEPGRRYFIARGTRVDIGEQFFVVS